MKYIVGFAYIYFKNYGTKRYEISSLEGAFPLQFYLRHPALGQASSASAPSRLLCHIPLGLATPHALKAILEECHAFQESMQRIKLFLVCAFPGEGACSVSSLPWLFVRLERADVDSADIDGDQGLERRG